MEITLRANPAAVTAAKAAWRLIGALVAFLHRLLDRILAVSLYRVTRAVGEGLFVLEAALRSYLVKSKYVDDDRYERKLDDDRIVCLWMGLKDAESITLREISFTLGVSDHYARLVRKAAKEWIPNFPRYAAIMKGYRSDSEKGDYRSGMK